MVPIRKSEPIRISVYYPTTEAGRQDLASRIADAHASTVIQRLKALSCSQQQKLELLDAVLETVKSKKAGHGLKR